MSWKVSKLCNMGVMGLVRAKNCSHAGLWVLVAAAVLRGREVEGVAEEAFRVLKVTLVAQDKEAMASDAFESASPPKMPMRQRRVRAMTANPGTFSARVLK